MVVDSAGPGRHTRTPEYRYAVRSHVAVEWAPTGLRVPSADATGINLSWTAPVDDGHGALLGYNVYRCEEGETACEPQWLVWVDGAATTSYTDGAVTAGTTYRYAVFEPGGRYGKRVVQRLPQEQVLIPDRRAGIRSSHVVEVKTRKSWVLI